MRILFSPVRSDLTLDASVSGDTITINGDAFDLSAATEAVPLTIASDWFLDEVCREAGEIVVTLMLPHGQHAPQETLFPVPVTVTSGPVPVPPRGADGPVVSPEISHQDAVSAHIDAVARQRDFDGALDAASYVNSTSPRWAREATAFIAWRDAVWVAAYAALAGIDAGDRGARAATEFIGGLPAMVWPE